MSAATPNDPNIDDGFYALFSPAGTRVFTATLSNFDTAVQTPTIVLSDTVRQDFNLTEALIEPPEITLEKTVGPDPQTCASMDTIDQVNGADVTYCFTVTNVGNTTVNRHTLRDEQLGILLDDFNYVLVSNATYSITKTTSLTTDMTSTATWTATIGGQSAVATDTTTVRVFNPGLVLTQTLSTTTDCGSGDTLLVQSSDTVTHCYTVEKHGRYYVYNAQPDR